MLGAPRQPVFVIPSDQLREGHVQTFEFPERGRYGFGLVLRRDGTARAYRNRCPHWNVPLNRRPEALWTADRQRLICSSHGAEFMPHDGLCVAGPCQGTSLEPLDVEEEDGELRVFGPTGIRVGRPRLSLKVKAPGSDDG